jgi:hypothetical protein
MLKRDNQANFRCISTAIVLRRKRSLKNSQKIKKSVIEKEIIGISI